MLNIWLNLRMVCYVFTVHSFLLLQFCSLNLNCWLKFNSLLHELSLYPKLQFNFLPSLDNHSYSQGTQVYHCTETQYCYEPYPSIYL
ncbi:hypothetical protein FGO68_gene3551 [Halteria grandinella]|uniref:Uncharacterized protein n=1 Tax=Halteria grandinella TaxID=5974 RepID=A0A8J8P1E9_HALGN|nr:hypothetical protein FGO68_gene3551 [Halteria grandinella]